MCAGDAVDDDLDQFDVDDEESDVDDPVERGCKGAFEHFLLSKCDEDHRAHAFFPAVFSVDVGTEADAVHDLLELPFEVFECCECDQ